MAAFCNDSIDQMEQLARETDNVFSMTDHGYVLATREASIESVSARLLPGVDVDLYSGKKEVQAQFPALAADIDNVIHVRRGGDFSSQQLGSWMLQQYRDAGGQRLRGEVTGISRNNGFSLHVKSGDESSIVRADVVINAAGPYVGQIAAMLDTDLPVKNVYQQKIAFEDTLAAIPRDMPFSIDLDKKTLAWSEEERAVLADDPELGWLTATMPAGTHCRPDGGERGTRIKLGWAYNETESDPQRELENEPAKDPQFPEIVIRGAAALLPALSPYAESPPTRFAHYGGYYTMTEENWPLIGSMRTPDTYVVGALSGFGSMSACAAGRLCAASACGGELPHYARALSLARYEDEPLMQELRSTGDKGLL